MLYKKDHFRLELITEDKIEYYARQIVGAMPGPGAYPTALANLSFFTEPLTLERETVYLTKTVMSDSERLYAIRQGEYDTLIGTIGLHEIDWHSNNARIGATIFVPSERGKGFGTGAIDRVLEVAFCDLGMHKIYLNVFAENERGRKLYARLGFVEEGTLRDEYLLRGVYHDMVRMSMKKSEWEARK